MLYLEHDVYVGRSFELYGEFSEGEVDVFRRALEPGQAVIEVGANIGAHTVFLAQQVGPSGSVLVFEPQRIVFQILCANLALNSITNVIAMQQAVGAESTVIRVPQLDFYVDNNVGGLELGQQTEGEMVVQVTLDGFRLPRCDFLKVDVEGMEEQVLHGAVDLIARCKPVIYVENDRRDKSESLIKFIDSLGYRMYIHKPPLYNSDNFMHNPTNVFENIISINLLCLPKDSPRGVHGLEQVQVRSTPTFLLP